LKDEKLCKELIRPLSVGHPTKAVLAQIYLCMGVFFTHFVSDTIFSLIFSSETALSYDLVYDFVLTGHDYHIPN
jgi:hypothetical protein